jgi:hypothetical protein
MKNLTILFILFSSISFSQQIDTDRPDQTESSSIIPHKSFQIESGFLIEFNEMNTSYGTTSNTLPTTLFRYGLFDWLELRLVTEYSWTKSGNFRLQGMNDLQLGAKIQLLKKENVNTEIAFMSHVIVPSGTRNYSARYGTINRFLISHQLNENVNLGYNLGWDYYGTGNGNFTYTVALGTSVGDRFGFFIEPFGEILEFEELVASFDAGVTYLITDKLQADFYFGTGLNHKNNFMGGGLSWLILNK